MSLKSKLKQTTLSFGGGGKQSTLSRFFAPKPKKVAAAAATGTAESTTTTSAKAEKKGKDAGAAKPKAKPKEKAPALTPGDGIVGDANAGSSASSRKRIRRTLAESSDEEDDDDAAAASDDDDDDGSEYEQPMSDAEAGADDDDQDSDFDGGAASDSSEEYMPKKKGGGKRLRKGKLQSTKSAKGGSRSGGGTTAKPKLAAAAAAAAAPPKQPSAAAAAAKKAAEAAAAAAAAASTNVPAAFTSSSPPPPASSSSSSSPPPASTTAATARAPAPGSAKKRKGIFAAGGSQPAPKAVTIGGVSKVRVSAGGKVTPESFGSMLIEKNKELKRARKKEKKYTPLESQFIKIKMQNRDVVLAVEVGYKYKFFGADAEIAGRILNIVCYDNGSFKAASIPTLRLSVHVRRLVEAGYKVGVVQQTDTAAVKKASDNKAGPFGRALKHLYTKATLIGEELDAADDAGATSAAGASNYLLCLNETGEVGKVQTVTISMVAIALGTGQIVHDTFSDGPDRTNLKTRIEHLAPTEILSRERLEDRTEKVLKHASVTGSNPPRIERVTKKAFETDDAVDVSGVAEIMAKLPVGAQACMRAVAAYLQEFGLTKILNLAKRATAFSNREMYMRLNGATLRNLEVFKNQTDATQRGSLYWVLNQTATPFGARMLRMWLSQPLLNKASIDARLDAVQQLCEGVGATFEPIRKMMHRLPDLERSLTAIFYGRCSPSAFAALLQALAGVQQTFGAESEVLKSALQGGSLGGSLGGGGGGEAGLLLDAVAGISKGLEDVTDLLRAIDLEAAKKNDKVNLFVDDEGLEEVQNLKARIRGVDKELNEHLRDIGRELQMPRMQWTTVSGESHMIELTKSQAKRAPGDWERISGTQKVERYRTPFAAKQLDIRNQLTETLNAEANQAWLSFLAGFADRYDQYRDVVAHLSELDCLLGLGRVASQPGYVRPTMLDPLQGAASIEIVEGRNPVVSQLLDDAQFVANDALLSNGPGNERCYIVTGPNMGGKSCYIRQVALIAVLAQVGSYVPAESASLTPLDAVFTRMGAEDDLFGKTSTFMHELTEASEILANATNRSLVIMDELGRGTSTHDGVAIAHATCTYMVKELQCLSLFVTHYPSIAELATTLTSGSDEGSKPLLGNFHMSFIEEEGAESAESADAGGGGGGAAGTAGASSAGFGSKITFLYKLIRGAAARSYGLNVARLADIPMALLEMAGKKSKELEAAVQKRRSAAGGGGGGGVAAAAAAGDASEKLTALLQAVANENEPAARIALDALTA